MEAEFLILLKTYLPLFCVWKGDGSTRCNQVIWSSKSGLQVLQLGNFGEDVVDYSENAI